MTHALKTWPQYFEQVESGEKTFELRKNDRDYKVGDVILLQEYNPESNQYTGNEWTGIITYTLADAVKFGLMDGYVILGIKEKDY